MADRTSNNALYEAALSQPELSIGPRPQKRPFFGLLSRGLAALDQYARDPNNIVAQALPFSDKADRVGITAGFSDLLALPGLTEFTRDLAYGDPLTTGKGQTLKPKDSTVDGVLNALPLVSPLSKGLAAATAKIPKPKSGEVNALFGGMARDSSPYFASHQMGTTPRSVKDDGVLPYDTMHLSTGITKDRLMSDFGSAPEAIWLIPDLQKIGPGTGLASIINRDSYTARGSALKAQRGLDAVKSAKGSWQGSEAYLREQALQRNAARFGTSQPRGGPKTEGSSYLSARDSGPGYGFENAPDPFGGSVAGVHNLLLADSPRFISLQQFLDSPRGAGVVGAKLNGVSGSAAANDWEMALRNFMRQRDSALPPSPEFEPFASAAREADAYNITPATLHLLRGLAGQGFPPPDPNVIRFLGQLGAKGDKNAKFRMQMLQDSEPFAAMPFSELQKGLAQLFPNTPDRAAQAQKLLSDFRKIPSSYAEHKNYGPVGLNADNFHGMIFDANNPYASKLRQAAEKRRLPYVETDTGNQKNLLDAYDELYTNQKFRREYGSRTNPLARGLASRATQPVPAAPAVNSAPVAPSQSSLLSEFLQTSGLGNGATPLAEKNADWALKNMSLAKAKAGEWDYVPDDTMPILYQYASGGGHTQLKTLLDDYKHASFTGNNADHDAALYKLLEEWDQVKPGAAPKPVAVASEASVFYPVFSETSSPDEIMQAIADYHAQKPWYYSSTEFETKYPHLTPEQVAALSNYSWSFTKSALPHEKDIPSITAQIKAAFGSPAKKLDLAGKSLADLKAMDVSGVSSAELQAYDAALEFAQAQANAAKFSKEPPALPTFTEAKPGPLNTGMAADAFAPIPPAGLENLVAFAQGEKAWNVDKKGSPYFFAHQFKGEFPGLTEEQAKALEDISFWTHLQKSNPDVDYWDKDITDAIQSLLSGK